MELGMERELRLLQLVGVREEAAEPRVAAARRRRARRITASPLLSGAPAEGRPGTRGGHQRFRRRVFPWG